MSDFAILSLFQPLLEEDLAEQITYSVERIPPEKIRDEYGAEDWFDEENLPPQGIFRLDISFSPIYDTPDTHIDQKFSIYLRATKKPEDLEALLRTDKTAEEILDELDEAAFDRVDVCYFEYNLEYDELIGDVPAWYVGFELTDDTLKPARVCDLNVADGKVYPDVGYVLTPEFGVPEGVLSHPLGELGIQVNPNKPIERIFEELFACIVKLRRTYLEYGSLDPPQPSEGEVEPEE